MSNTQWPGGAQPPMGGDAQSIQEALQRMTPEQRMAMFEPFKDEMEGLDRQAQPQQYHSAGGALMGGLGNMFANMDRKDLLKRKQADSGARVDARYGLGADDPAALQLAQAMALRASQGQQDPFGLQDLRQPTMDSDSSSDE